MKPFSAFIRQLRYNLTKPLPAQKAHNLMEALSAKYLGMKSGEQTRKSAVLLLLYPYRNKFYFPLILRSSYDGFHSGEVGFPGGRQEWSDENLIQTALREAEEEIGLNPDEVQILGTLTEVYIGPSDFLVLPVIGFIPYRPDFLPNSREVGQIFEVTLDYFRDPDIVKSGEIQIPGDLVLTPYYDLEGYKIWGATAKVINEILVVVGENLYGFEDLHQ